MDEATQIAILAEIRRLNAKFIHAEIERARHIDSFWLPSPSPWWPERLAYEPRKVVKDVAPHHESNG